MSTLWLTDVYCKTRLALLVMAVFAASSAVAQNTPAPFINDNRTRGDNLLVLRLAVSSTGEYTQEVGGTQNVKATINTVLAHINEVYGREYSVRFELIANNDVLIYTDPGSDPWPDVPAGGGCVGGAPILAVQANVIDAAIGAANYDISHVFADNSLGGGCAGGFKSGVSFPSVDIVRHEMGHQFSQSHTVNTSTARDPNWAYELGDAGRSIQGGNSVANAHAASFHQLVQHLMTTAAGIGTNVATGNTIPTVNAGPDRIIPRSTPFLLTAVAADPDTGDSLTYVWDQLDLGVAQAPPLANDAEGPLFSRLLPTASASRSFPQLSSVLSNTYTGPLENLPTQAREINLRVTVNDNHMISYQGSTVPASGVASDDVRLTVVNSGPFRLTSPNGPGAFAGGSSQTVSRDVAGTNQAPISTSNVKISLSTDGGQTFPIVVEPSTPNDGTQQVSLPNIDTSQARMKVEAVGNVYFDVSDQNFSVNQNPLLPGIALAETGANTLVNETGQSDTYTIAVLTAPAGTVSVQVTADAQVEISTDGTSFGNSLRVALNSTTPQQITVRGKFDTLLEGPHLGSVSHMVAESADATNYPVGLSGRNLSVNVSDAQLPPLVGIDFDTGASTAVPNNWVKLGTTIGQSASDIPLDDGTPTSIDFSINSPSCGFGGCVFDVGHNSGAQNSPRHVQGLEAVGGVAVSRLGPVTAIWSGLEAQKKYRVYVFAHYFIGGNINQTVTITGDGSNDPAPFVQTVGGSLQVNDQLSSNQPLPSFAKEVTSTAGGTVTVSVDATNETWISGLAIQPVPNFPLPNQIFRNGFE